MQNTRLNILVGNLSERFVGWLGNPWRRISVVIISILFGNFLANVASTTAGQQARVDALIAAVMTITVEVAVWLVYIQPQQLRLTTNSKPTLVWWKETLNGVRIGFTYGMFLLALTLGS